MADGAITLAYTEWMLVERDGKPVEIAADDLAPILCSTSRKRALRAPGV